jgi:hypothetical protein
MAKLTGKKKAEFLKRMEKGRRKAKRKNGPKRTAKKNPRRKAAKKNPRGKLTGAKKREFLARMAKGRRKAGNPRSKNARKKTNAHRPKHTAHRRRRNQEDMSGAEAMFETFHQKAPGQILTYEGFMQARSEFAELGQLRALRFYLDSANPSLPLTRFGSDCLVVATADGSNIYFVGGDQSVDLAALGIASDKDIVELGPCNYIEYLTVKGFHDFEPIRYHHEFGEEDKILPTLAYDQLNQTLFLESGNYRVKREGIVN